MNPFKAPKPPQPLSPGPDSPEVARIRQAIRTGKGYTCLAADGITIWLRVHDDDLNVELSWWRGKTARSLSVNRSPFHCRDVVRDSLFADAFRRVDQMLEAEGR